MSATPSGVFLARLAGLKSLRPNSWYLIAAATSTALGHGHTWVPSIYRHATIIGPSTTSSLDGTAPPHAQSSIKPIPSSSLVEALPPTKDASTASQLVVRRLKEALFKSAILIGVPRVIEASFALRAVTENTPDFDTTFTREGIDATAEGNNERGLAGLERVYRKQYGPISSKMGAGMKEIQWMSENITYGLFLAPVSEVNTRYPLSFPETEMVVLSCLIAHRANREVLWHLRGSLRAGLSPEEVEAVQSAVELVADELGVDVRTDMPRVGQVTEEDDLSEL